MAENLRKLLWPAIAGKPTSPWLWQRGTDLFWVAGGGSLLFAAVIGPLSLFQPRLALYVVASFMFLTWLCNAPHYAATYELIYRERDRRPAAWATLRRSIPFALAALVVCGISFRAVAPFVTRVYLTWSTYHYGAQNFGLAVMYAARSGSPLERVDKRGMQLAFFAASAFAMILTNTDVIQFTSTTLATPTAQASASTAATDLVARIAQARLPPSAYYVALALAIAGAIGLARIAVRRARAGRPLPLPTILLFCAQWAWFVLPRLRLHARDDAWVGPVLATWLPYAIPFFHCAQYLGVTGWRARLTSAVRPHILLAGLVIGGWFLFQGSVYAWEWAFRRPAIEAVAAIVGVVNIHHFFIDGLIWKRDRIPGPLPAEARVAPAVDVGAAALPDVG